ncbi:MAG: hypothetical protein M3T56_03335 [Chloroflexota bacterium]|nr:hypothetical protein [Chloroflexota bacterium]
MRIEIQSNFPDLRFVALVFVAIAGVAIATLRSGDQVPSLTAPILNGPTAAPVAPTAAPATTLAPTKAPGIYEATPAPTTAGATAAPSTDPLATIAPNKEPDRFDATAAPTPAGGAPGKDSGSGERPFPDMPVDPPIQNDPNGPLSPVPNLPPAGE